MKVISKKVVDNIPCLYDIKVKNNHNYYLANGMCVHNSGKGFALSKFLQGELFKTFDVDALKSMILSLDKFQQKYPELRNLDLRNPKDVFTLHTFVKERGWDTQVPMNVISNLVSKKNKETLPNIAFDVTLKDLSKLEQWIPTLQKAGYDSKNIHLVWVLTDIKIAIKNNANRSRVVPEDILIQTHKGASQSMDEILSNRVPKGFDGEIYIILNNPSETVFWLDKRGNPISSNQGGFPIVKGFNYIQVKKSGKAPLTPPKLKERLVHWIENNVPEDVLDNMKFIQGEIKK